MARAQHSRSEGEGLPLLGLSLTLTLALSIAASAATYSESSEGDLSNNYTAPTLFVLGVGSNLLSGTLAGGENDLDLFTLTVPIGTELTAIRIIDFSGGGGGSFLGLQAGMMLSDSPIPSDNWVDPIANTIISSSDAASDLDVLGRLTDNSPFFSALSLPAGDYAGWLNENTFPSSYTIDFVVTPVPEPSSSVLAILALACMVGHRRRR